MCDLTKNTLYSDKYTNLRFIEQPNDEEMK